MTRNLKLNNLGIFILLWVLLFALYLPAARAGFVTDFTGWLYEIKNDDFLTYVNRSNFHVKSLYQFTQCTTYFFYLIFKANPWLWHLLFITLQALNGFLLWLFCSRLFLSSGVNNESGIALAGVALFCICPAISEVVVWEPSYHYLQGLLMMLAILICLQNYLHVQKRSYIIIALFIYTLSLFSLEYFYLTPLLSLALIRFYKYALQYQRIAYKKAMLYFTLPLFLLFTARLVLFKLLYHDWVSRIGSATLFQSLHDYIIKPPKYIFHLVFLGRFFSHEYRQKVYAFCESTLGLGIFYTLFAVLIGYILLRFRKFNNKAKLLSLVFLFVILATALVLPMWFPDLQLVAFDRYMYMLSAFLFMLIALLISYIPRMSLALVVFAFIALINLRYTIRVNRYWMKAQRIDEKLLDTFPGSNDKITILLDQPENMHGIPMIQATHGNEFKLMYNLLKPDSIQGLVFDGLSFNMETPEDGAHVTVLNDSMARITLNQWGTWWWFDGFGATDRENEYYKIHVPDAHFYDITLRKPPAQYRLLYQTAGNWKEVDWNRKNEDQY